MWNDRLITCGPSHPSYEWDEQISPGKSPSKHEEVVPEARELMNCGAGETVWLKGAELRENIRSVLGQSADEMSNARWIDHLLKRLSPSE